MFQVQQSSNTHSLATDMSGSNVCIVGNAGEGDATHICMIFFVFVLICMHVMRLLTAFHMPQLPDTPSYDTDMFGINVHFIDGTGGRCCYSNLCDFVSFCANL
jgi:hypothetical protein